MLPEATQRTGLGLGGPGPFVLATELVVYKSDGNTTATMGLGRTKRWADAREAPVLRSRCIVARGERQRDREQNGCRSTWLTANEWAA